MDDDAPTDFDAKLTQEREYVATLLTGLAATLRALPIEDLADVLPAVAMPLEDIVTRVRQLGVTVSGPTDRPT